MTRLSLTLQGPAKVLHQASTPQCLLMSTLTPCAKLLSNVGKLWQMNVLLCQNERTILRCSTYVFKTGYYDCQDARGEDYLNGSGWHWYSTRESKSCVQASQTTDVCICVYIHIYIYVCVRVCTYVPRSKSTMASFHSSHLQT